jgi:hypothetical protein
MAKSAISITIPAGESLSSPADLTTNSRQLAMVLAPAEWTPAMLSFQISDDGMAFYDLIDDRGDELHQAISAGSAINLPLPAAPVFLKVRSGLSAAPVQQAADRLFKLMTV